MQRKSLSPTVAGLLVASKRLAKETEAAAVVMLSDSPYKFAEIRKKLQPAQLLVASNNPDVQRAATADDVDLVPLDSSSETRQVQLSQALLEAIADEHLESGDTIVALYSGYERDTIDSLSIINLGDHRDLHLSIRRQRQMCIRDRSGSNRQRLTSASILGETVARSITFG